MENKKDWYYLFKLLCLVVIIILDATLTYGAMNLGFEEGNPIIKYLFTQFDVGFVLVLVTIVSISLCAFLIYIRNKIDDEDMVWVNIALIIAIIWRAIVIGIWFGAIGVRQGVM